MKKALFPFLLNLLLAVSSQAQTQASLYTGVFYKLARSVNGLREFGDTAIVAPNKPLFPPLVLHAKEEVLVMSYPTAHWAQVVKRGIWCYVPSNILVPSEKPRPNATPAKIGAPAGTSSNNITSNNHNPPNSGSTDSYQTIHTGPRGGHYYINSNGNKTYIKRK